MSAPALTACVPGSKSLTQRCLVVAALARVPATLRGALPCDDSDALSVLLRSLGVGVDWEGDVVRVQPAPLVASGHPVHVGNAGTALRFGACLSLLTEGEVVLDGTARMRQRPLGELADALSELGVQVRWAGQPGFPPLGLRRVRSAQPTVTVDVSRSSQFASGLLLVAPNLPHGLRVKLAGEAVSLPYVSMTAGLMRRAGARVTWTDERCVQVEPGGYGLQEAHATLEVEPDWSSAAFVLGAGWLLGRQVQMAPSPPPPGASLQGDARFVELLAELERPRLHTLDLAPTPDLVPPLAAVALFASHPTQIRGAAHLRIKESDRLAVLAEQLGRLGASVRERADGLDIEPLPAGTRHPPAGPRVLDPADDHRMAMAFGLVGLRLQGVTVSEPGCVSKSFPTFWTTLDDLREQAARTS